MACGRHAFGLVELDGWLYASGGSDFSRSEYNSLERYDPVKLVSSQGSSASQVKYFHNLNGLDGYALRFWVSILK